MTHKFVVRVWTKWEMESSTKAQHYNVPFLLYKTYLCFAFAFKLVFRCDTALALAEFSHPLQCSVLEPQINFPVVYKI